MIKDVMFYKEYIGSIHYSTDDDVFFGKIEGIVDSVSFEGSSVKELKEAFHEAVDDYIELCKINGKEPEKAYKGTFNIRISPELHKMAVREAICEGVSLNQYIEKILEKNIQITDH